VNRLEAAVKAWDHHWGDRYGDEALEEMGEEVQVALNAADAVMFSDEAIERAAKAIRDFNWPDYEDQEHYPIKDYMGDARVAMESFKRSA
jgi:hypothetical protein